MEKVRLSDKFALFTEHWSPKVVGELNGQQVKLAKLLGEFVWHRHENEDELFLVVRGHLVIRFRDREIALDPGEFLVVPRGVDHQPYAEREVHAVLFEPASTRNTGEVTNEITREELERL